jgi:hypothetical protein
VTAQCIYCGSVTDTTSDHVPPKAMFPRPRPSDLVVVPSCRSCNNGFAQDDEYFRLVIATRQGSAAFPGIDGVEDSIVRSLKRPEAAGWASSVRNAFEIIEDGEHTIGSLTIELARVSRVGRRLARAFYYHRTRKSLPLDAEVRASTRFMTATRRAKHTLERLRRRPSLSIGEGAFEYRYIRDEAPFRATAWLFTFYGAQELLAITRTHEASGLDQ